MLKGRGFRPLAIDIRFEAALDGIGCSFRCCLSSLRVHGLNEWVFFRQDSTIDIQVVGFFGRIVYPEAQGFVPDELEGSQGLGDLEDLFGSGYEFEF